MCATSINKANHVPFRTRVASVKTVADMVNFVCLNNFRSPCDVVTNDSLYGTEINSFLNLHVLL